MCNSIKYPTKKMKANVLTKFRSITWTTENITSINVYFFFTSMHLKTNYTNLLTCFIQHMYHWSMCVSKTNLTVLGLSYAY